MKRQEQQIYTGREVEVGWRGRARDFDLDRRWNWHVSWFTVVSRGSLPGKSTRYLWARKGDWSFQSLWVISGSTGREMSRIESV